MLGEATVCLPLGNLIDLTAEAARLQKELAKVTEEIARLHKKLSNDKFVASAPAEIVEAEREKLTEYREAQEKLSVALDSRPRCRLSGRFVACRNGLVGPFRCLKSRHSATLMLT